MTKPPKPCPLFKSDNCQCHLREIPYEADQSRIDSLFSTIHKSLQELRVYFENAPQTWEDGDRIGELLNSIKFRASNQDILLYNLISDCCYVIEDDIFYIDVLDRNSSTPELKFIEVGPFCRQYDSPYVFIKKYILNHPDFYNELLVKYKANLIERKIGIKRG